jgi:hypothetical protein
MTLAKRQKILAPSFLPRVFTHLVSGELFHLRDTILCFFYYYDELRVLMAYCGNVFVTSN